MTLEVAARILDEQATKVGFSLEQSLGVPDAPKVPGECKIWCSPYAIILMIVAEAEKSALLTAAQAGQEWVDLACIHQEMKVGSVVDGYLLVLFEKEPDEDAQAEIHRIELDPTACRKHFAWPNVKIEGDDELRWSRLFRVTALGLPSSPETSRITGTPILESELQKRLLVDIKQMGAQEAARQHAQNPQRGPDA